MQPTIKPPPLQPARKLPDGWRISQHGTRYLLRNTQSLRQSATWHSSYEAALMAAQGVRG